MCIAIVDIDHFKNVNDTHGHETGDYVLKQFTELIKKNIRQYDVLARHGGEEFAILFPDSDKKTCFSILSRIKDALSEIEFTPDGKVIKFSFSGGIVSLDEESLRAHIDEFISLADKRLYIAKESGRNQIIDAG